MSTAIGQTELTGGRGKADRPRVVLTLGKFDGVHAGHRHLLTQVMAEADQRGAASAAVMLHPDPAAVLAGRRVPLLTTVDERAARLRAFGVDHVLPLTFDTALAGLSATEFLDRVALVFDVVAWVVGPDFAFGRDRSGTTATLRSLGRERGFDVLDVKPLGVDGQKLGSRAVRTLIASGDIRGATTLLRAPPRLVGTVVRGAGRGRLLGFPTANLALAADFEVPGFGVYTVATSWRWPEHPAQVEGAFGLASVGVRPTFDHGPRIVEIYLLDHSGDLYGCEMTVDFLLYQRGEERFASAETLIAQMHRDEALARTFLAHRAVPRWQATGRTEGRHQTEYVARGLDLADLCSEIARGLAGQGNPGPVADSVNRRRRFVSGQGESEAAIVRSWLAHLAELPAPLAGAEVYQATETALAALVSIAPRASGPPPGPSSRLILVRGPEADAWGGRQAVLAGPAG